jgi:hypothetical protein
MSQIFNEKQQRLLSALIPGLKDGTIGCNWTVFYIDGEAAIFDDMHTANFEELGWSSASPADFTKFVKSGLFSLEEINGDTRIYALDDTAILDLFSSGFDAPTTGLPT